MNPIGSGNNSGFDLLGMSRMQHTPAKRASKSLSPLRDANPPALTRADKVKPEPDKAQIERAREAAEGLVSTSLIIPILKQVRESNNAAPPFGPTQAEKQFGALLDNQLADEIAHAAQFPIVDRMVEQFTRNLAQTGETKATTIEIDA
jgi:Rod binding domain-containing protein